MNARVSENSHYLMLEYAKGKWCESATPLTTKSFLSLELRNKGFAGPYQLKITSLCRHMKCEDIR